MTDKEWRWVILFTVSGPTTDSSGNCSSSKLLILSLYRVYDQHKLKRTLSSTEDSVKDTSTPPDSIGPTFSWAAVGDQLCAGRIWLVQYNIHCLSSGCALDLLFRVFCGVQAQDPQGHPVSAYTAKSISVKGLMLQDPLVYKSWEQVDISSSFHPLGTESETYFLLLFRGCYGAEHQSQWTTW